MSCHSTSNSNGRASNGKNGKHLTFALAGNANVGKSVHLQPTHGLQPDNRQLARQNRGPRRRHPEF